MANKLKVSLKRKCPDCGCDKEYWYKMTYNRAVKNNAKCGTCSQIGIKPTKEVRRKMGDAKIGTTRPQKVKDKIRETLIGHKRYTGKQKKEWIKNISSSKMGHEVSQEVRDKIGKTVREYRFNEIKEKFGVKFPNYNSVGCGIINDYNKKYGFNFQHAENGGEVCIDGYWPDGIDEKRKTIIEIDEKRHFNPDGTYKEKDTRRQKYLEGLGYKFIRIKV